MVPARRFASQVPLSHRIHDGFNRVPLHLRPRLLQAEQNIVIAPAEPMALAAVPLAVAVMHKLHVLDADMYITDS